MTTQKFFPNAQFPIPNVQFPMPNTSLREAAPTTSLRDAVRERSVQVPNALFIHITISGNC
ncbi:MAG: hypothetical protein V7K83_32420 [Nostoc sp.]